MGKKCALVYKIYINFNTAFKPHQLYMSYFTIFPCKKVMKHLKNYYTC